MKTRTRRIEPAPGAVSRRVLLPVALLLATAAAWSVGCPIAVASAAVHHSRLVAADGDAVTGDLMLAGISPAKRIPAHTDSQQAEPAAQTPQYEPKREAIVNDFLSTAKEIKEHQGDDSVPMRSTETGKLTLHGVLMATKTGDPTLTEDCKKRAMQFSVDSLKHSLELKGDAAALQAAAQYIQKHIGNLMAMDGKISYSQYLQTVGNCRKFCAPLVASLLPCHVLSVARLKHGIVLFGVNRHELNPSYLTAEGLLTKVAEQTETNPDLNVFLIGRASEIGDLRYKRQLSGLRALAVQDALIKLGVPAKRVTTTWFGGEPPRLDKPIAKEYGLQPFLERFGIARMNQSVVVVLYDGAVTTVHNQRRESDGDATSL